MHIYSAKIRLGGKLGNEIRKENITASEILILRSIHGDDAVTEIKHTGTAKRTDATERARLFGSVGDSIPLYRADQFRKVFVNDFSPLPQVYVEPQSEGEDVTEMDDDIESFDDIEPIPVDEAIKPKPINRGLAAQAAKREAARAAEETATAALS